MKSREQIALTTWCRPFPSAWAPGAEATEVELECDYHLRYEYVMDAITAVSGYIDRTPDGQAQIVELVKKIKFSPPKDRPGS